MSDQKNDAESTQIEAQTRANLAMIIGGVTLARAVQGPNLADKFANSVQIAMKAK